MSAHASRPSAHRPAAGFTLVEIMIGSSIGSFVLLGILSAFLTLGRSGARLFNYNVMETESRRALDEFSQDVRMASDVVWNSSSSITLTVPDNYTSNANQVTYAYDSSTTGATKTSFYRTPSNSDATDVTSKTVLVHNVTSCIYKRYDRSTPAVAATTDVSTKRIELALKISITSTTTVAATENAISATYLLRNKLAN